MSLEQPSLSIVFEDKKRLENDTPLDDPKTIAELSNSQLGNVTQG